MIAFVGVKYSLKIVIYNSIRSGLLIYLKRFISATVSEGCLRNQWLPICRLEDSGLVSRTGLVDKKMCLMR